MSAGREPAQCIPRSGATAGMDTAVGTQGTQDPADLRLRRLLLLAIDTHNSQYGTGPTVPELAADLGIRPDFGHRDLVARLRHELSFGHVVYFSSRFRLTLAGRDFADSATPYR